MLYRNPAYLALAAKAPYCMVPGCGLRNDGTIVAMHRNEGKGMGMKNPDYQVAFGCFKCHAFMDCGAALSREDRRAMWEEAYWRSLEWLWTSGLICIAAEPVAHVNPEKRPSKKIAKGRPLQSGRKIQSAREFPKGQPLKSRGFDKRRQPA